MRKLVVTTFVTMDGVMQAPGGAGEDPSGGFSYEGWLVPYFDDAIGAQIDEWFTGAQDFLRRRAPTPSTPATGASPPRRSRARRIRIPAT